MPIKRPAAYLAPAEHEVFSGLENLKVVLLAGGLGTRLAEETSTRPKPMVEIGGKPILWHLMQIYARAGCKDFIIACGYRQEVIKDYFRSLYATTNDLTVDFATGRIDVHVKEALDWTVHLVDTGSETMTGGRLKRLADQIGDRTFLCTYGDGLASIDIAALVECHRRGKREATVTAVRPPARFGVLDIDGDRVRQFVEKPQTSEGWINGGFFVFEPSVLDRIESDTTILEHDPLRSLAADSQLSVYKHQGFWQPMDTLRDKRLLEDMWASGSPQWVRP